MRAAKLQLDSYFVQEVFFQAKLKRKSTETPDPKPRDLMTEVAIGENKDEPLSKMCRLTVELADNKKSLPYDFKVVMVGFFNIDPKCDESFRGNLFSINAPSMLFTAAREILLLLSSRSSIGPVMLPTVVFPGVKIDDSPVEDSPKVVRRVKTIAS